MDEKQLKTAAGNLCFTDVNQYGNGRDIAKGFWKSGLSRKLKLKQMCLTMGGLLYVPDSATEENPAPAAVVVHGWWKTSESQSSTAMELGRGIVALAIDMYDTVILLM